MKLGAGKDFPGHKRHWARREKKILIGLFKNFKFCSLKTVSRKLKGSPQIGKKIAVCLAKDSYPEYINI